MIHKYTFTDESGCFTFDKAKGSKYFILCTIVMDDCAVGNDLLSLRRKLAWENHDLGEYFHATEDKQLVRDAVFEIIRKHAFSIQATIIEKSKAKPDIRKTREVFYKHGYFYHFKHGTSKQLGSDQNTLVTTASLGVKKEKAAFQNAVHDVLKQTKNTGQRATDFLPCQSDPCLQVADYCAWAIQRKWERGDDRSYILIQDKITYEHDLLQSGEINYY
jgi:hypothetical protein